MTSSKEQFVTVRKIVVFFDICSSTRLLEDLLRTENQHRWRNLHIGLKRFLVEHSKQMNFEVYKFLGDGWILLFDESSTSGTDLMNFLRGIGIEYRRLFEKLISPVLENHGYAVGVTYGVDAGSLVRVVLNKKGEYVGRALNIAARLQGSIKAIDDNPEGKLLISNNAHAVLRLSKVVPFVGDVVQLELRNVSGGEKYRARRIDLDSPIG
jgi:class 3 adenylate cyclase